MGRIVTPQGGLSLNTGSLSRKEGVFTQLDNCVLDALGVIRKRQGCKRNANGTGGPIWKLLTSKILGSNLLINSGTNTSASALKFGDGSAVLTSITGTYTNQPATRMQMAVGLQNHYLTTDEGLRRIEHPLTSSSGFFAGLPFGLGLDLTGPANVLVNGGSGFLADQGIVAYRSYITKKDGDGNLIVGPVSGRTIVRNMTGTTGYGTTTNDVACRVLLPEALGSTGVFPHGSLSTSYTLWTFRSEVATGTPEDDMWLVSQHQLTSTDLSNGYYQFTDNTPDAFLVLSPPLYTSPTVGEVGLTSTGSITTGILLNNNFPLRARAVETYASSLWLGDVQGYSKFAFTILGVGATGLNVGDTITINGKTFTAIAPGAPANNQFVVYTASANASENIQRTAQNLVEAVNKSTTSGLNAYASYFDDGTGLPGQVVLWAQLPVGGDFAITATIAAGTGATRPDLTLSGGYLSAQDQQPSWLMFSKPGLPDAFPAVNFLPIPRQDARILALRALRNALFVFTDVGLYMVTGTDPGSFSLQEFEPTFHLLGRDTLALCDDAIYAWGIEGIARITSAGVQYVSRPIEPLLWNLVTPANTGNVATQAFGTAYRTQHKVLFHYPSSTNANCQRALVYDTRENGWTQWKWPNDSGTTGRSCAVARYSDDYLFAGQWNNASTDAWLFQELRTIATTDYEDMLTGGSTVAIDQTIQWNPNSPAPDEVSLFDQLHVFWEVSETVTAWTSPSLVAASFTNDMRDSGGDTLQPRQFTTGMRLSRCDVTLQERQTTRLIVTLQHQVKDEFMGLEGMALLVTTQGDGTVRS